VYNASLSDIILMLRSIVTLLFIVAFNDNCFIAGLNPLNFSFNPGNNYELIRDDEFESVAPIKTIIDGAPTYSPNSETE
jgi:hypothetical protein